MTDIKETIQGLYALKTYLASKAIEEHGHARESLIGMQKVVDSAVNLLKRQQPEPVRIGRFPVGNKLFSHCPRCGLTLDEFIHQPSELRPLYCPICGQAVNFE